MEVLNPAGGGLLHEIYPLLDHYQLSDGEPKSETIVKLLLEIEQILMAMPGGLSSDFCLCILRHKKPKTDDKSLRQRLAGNAKDVLDSLKSLAE